MDTPQRPDLSGAPDEIVTYIEWLESKLAAVPGASQRSRISEVEPSEPPTTENIITISRDGVAKRTPRHLYTRQKRGGMGVFDLELAEEDIPAALSVADESEALVIFTSGGRAYRLPVSALPESPVRARGQSISPLVQLPPHEKVVAALPAIGPDGRKTNIVLLSERGWVRTIRASFLGPSLIQGTIFHDLKEGGPLVAAAWTSGQDELFIATRDGKAIRFAESQVPARGCLGIRLDPADAGVAVCGVTSQSGVFLISQDGSGTIRLMSGFNANKAPGAGGKIAMKSSVVVGAVTQPEDDLLVISRLVR
ncbi:MAG: DNA gyrase C-terminal beta-propeller domain-containing protein [Chloroflexota bacterium]